MTDTGDASGILIEAEDFLDYGGWLLDSQFETVMGSPYLLAHGLGRPVADATTVIAVAQAGDYDIWVRAKDWAPSHHPGRFTLAIAGVTLQMEFGANGRDWSWQSAGRVSLPAGDVPLALHDLTGFDGRCDAIYLGRDGVAPPNEVDETSRAWRKKLRGLPDLLINTERDQGAVEIEGKTIVRRCNRFAASFSNRNQSGRNLQRTFEVVFAQLQAQ